MCHWCSCHILTSSVIYYLIRRTETWNLFVLYNNEKPFFPKYFNITRKPAFCPAFALKKPFDVIFDRFKMKQFHWLLCVAKNCDWSRKIAPLSNLTCASLLVEWKLTAKAELNCEIYKSWRKCWSGKIKAVFVIGAALWAEKLGCCWKLREKKYPRKTCGYGQPRGLLIRVLNERSVNYGGDFCLLLLVILKSAWYSVGDTF